MNLLANHCRDCGQEIDKTLFICDPCYFSRKPKEDKCKG